MKGKGYIVGAYCWNGQSWELVSKCANTVESALGLASLLLREVRPFQVLIQAEDYQEIIAHPGQVASRLNSMESGSNTTLDCFEDP